MTTAADLGFYDVRDFAGVQAAIDACGAAGGGEVRLTRGVTVLGSLNMRSNVWLRGAGAGATTLKLAGGVNSHLVSCTSLSNVVVSDLTLDHDRDHQTAGHALRVENCTDLRAERLSILNAKNYGIGLEAGTLKRISLKDLYLEKSGDDLIDFKNHDNANEGIAISNIVGVDPGLDGPTSTGIDIRGPALLSNIHIYIKTSPTGPTGIRFRQSSVENGIGGQRSSLSGFLVQCAAGIPQGLAGVAVLADDVTVSGGTITNMARGVQVGSGAVRNKVVGADAIACYYGHEDLGVGTEWVASNADGCSHEGWRLNAAQSPKLIACRSLNNSVGYRRINGAAGEVLVACEGTVQ